MAPIHDAASSGDAKRLADLLNAGGNVNEKGSRGCTALHSAAGKGHVDAMTLLLLRGADPSATNKHGFTALHSAAASGHVDAMTLLLDRGADMNVTSLDGWTALHRAATNGHVAAMTLLLERGADPRATDIDGWTALHRAATNGHVGAMTLLLDRGADLRATNNGGQTALHLAAKNGEVGAMTLLFERGADLKAIDKTGKTPLDLARHHGKTASVEYLEDAEASIIIGKRIDSRAIIASSIAEANRTLTLCEEDHRAPRQIAQNMKSSLAQFPAANPKSQQFLDTHSQAMQILRTDLESSPPPPASQIVNPAFKTGYAHAPPSIPTTLGESRRVLERSIAESTSGLASARQRGCKAEEALSLLNLNKASGLKDRIVAVESHRSSLPNGADAAQIDAFVASCVEEVDQCRQHITRTLAEHSSVENGFPKVVTATTDIYSAERGDHAISTTQGIVEALSQTKVKKGEAALVADLKTAEPAADTEAQALREDVNKLAALVEAHTRHHRECLRPSLSMFGVATTPPLVVSAPLATSAGDPPSLPEAAPVHSRTLDQIAESVRDQMRQAEGRRDDYVRMSHETVESFTGQVHSLVGQLVLSQMNERANREYAQVMFDARSLAFFEAFMRTALAEKSNQVSLQDQLDNQVQSAYDDTIATLAGHVRFYAGQLAVGDSLLSLIEYVENDYGTGFVDELGALLEDARRAKVRLAVESAFKVAELYGEARYYTRYIIHQLESEISRCDSEIHGYALALKKAPPGQKKDKIQEAFTEAQASNAAYKADLDLRLGSTAPNIFLEAVLLPKHTAAQERLIDLIRMGLAEAVPPPGLALEPVVTVNGFTLMDPVSAARADFEGIAQLEETHLATQSGSGDGDVKLLKCESG